MPTNTSEKQLETFLVSYLCDQHKYEEGMTEDYNKDYVLDTERVKRFQLFTQKKIIGVEPPTERIQVADKGDAHE